MGSFNRNESTTDQRPVETTRGNCHVSRFLQILDAIQSCFDFSELDAVSPALDLIVAAAREIDEAVRAEFGESSGFVDTAIATRPLKKCLACLLFVIPVSRA